jgi:hypothetical protein
MLSVGVILGLFFFFLESSSLMMDDCMRQSKLTSLGLMEDFGLPFKATEAKRDIAGRLLATKWNKLAG